MRKAIRFAVFLLLMFAIAMCALSPEAKGQQGASQRTTRVTTVDILNHLDSLARNADSARRIKGPTLVVVGYDSVVPMSPAKYAFVDGLNAASAASVDSAKTRPVGPRFSSGATVVAIILVCMIAMIVHAVRNLRPSASKVQ